MTAKRKRRRSGWTPAIGAARFAMTTGRAAAAANPAPLTEGEQALINGRIDAAIAALWGDVANEQHLYDICEALNVTQALVDAGAAPEYADCVAAAVYAGAQVREAWKTHEPGSASALASPGQIEAIRDGLDVHRGILAAGLYGHELLQAMDIMKLRQKEGKIVKIA